MANGRPVTAEVNTVTVAAYPTGELLQGNPVFTNEAVVDLFIIESEVLDAKTRFWICV